MEKSAESDSTSAETMQKLIAENAALLDAKVTAEKASASVSSEVHLFIFIIFTLSNSISYFCLQFLLLFNWQIFPSTS